MNQALAVARNSGGAKAKTAFVSKRMVPVFNSGSSSGSSLVGGTPVAAMQQKKQQQQSKSSPLSVKKKKQKNGKVDTDLLAMIQAGQLQGANKPFVGMDAYLDIQNKSSTPLGHSVFDKKSVNSFEGNNKQVWLDLKSGWCHLCQEPIGGSMGIHLGDREHICLQLFLHLYAAYPREWNTTNLLQNAEHLLPSINQFSTFSRGDEMSHLHVHIDARRRAELESLLRCLTEEPHKAISHCLRGQSPMGFWYSGERMWKINLTRLCTQMLPPMSAGVMTTFTHKCWGRTNLERMYDALNIAKIVSSNGAEPKTTKDHKAYFMRLIFWELQSAETRPHEEVDEVTRYLVQVTKRRLCFEMIFLQSMQYMNRVQDVYGKLGAPSEEDLLSWNLL